MKSLRRNLKWITFFFLALFALLILYFVYAVNTYGGRWFTSAYNTRLQQQKSLVIPGRILDRNRKELAGVDDEGQRAYAKDKELRFAVSHVIGDNAGQTSGGVEAFQSRYLLGFDNNAFERIYESFMGEKTRGSDIVISIDADLSKYISEVMGKYDGAVAVMNYKTGEVLSIVSKPGFDPNKVKDYAGDEGAPLVNRATMGRYTPGSVFKIITAAAAVRYFPQIDDATWICDGPMVFDSRNQYYLPDMHFTQEQDQEFREQQQNKTPTPAETPEPEQTQEAYIDDPDDIETLDSGGDIGNYLLLRDYQSVYHGEIDLKNAFAVSCNHTFASIALSLGNDKLQKMSQAFAFDEDFLFPDLMLYPSKFEEGTNQYQSGWSSIGQYKDLVTPFHMCMISATIGNDGIMMEPKILRSVINGRNYQTNLLKPKEFKKVLSTEEAEKLTEYMRYCITNGTGKSAAVKNLEVCGKTGTAEVSSDKKIGNHAWFTGFIDDPDHPIAIAVVLEHAGSGGGKAAPVAGKILSKAVGLGY